MKVAKIRHTSFSITLWLELCGLGLFFLSELRTESYWELEVIIWA